VRRAAGIEPRWHRRVALGRSRGRRWLQASRQRGGTIDDVAGGAGDEPWPPLPCITTSRRSKPAQCRGPSVDELAGRLFGVREGPGEVGLGSDGRGRRPASALGSRPCPRRLAGMSKAVTRPSGPCEGEPASVATRHVMWTRDRSVQTPTFPGVGGSLDLLA